MVHRTQDYTRKRLNKTQVYWNTNSSKNVVAFYFCLIFTSCIRRLHSVPLGEWGGESLCDRKMKLTSFWYPEQVKCTIPELSKQVASVTGKRGKKKKQKSTLLIKFYFNYKHVCRNKFLRNAIRKQRWTWQKAHNQYLHQLHIHVISYHIVVRRDCTYQSYMWWG